MNDRDTETKVAEVLLDALVKYQKVRAALDPVKVLAGALTFTETIAASTIVAGFKEYDPAKALEFTERMCKQLKEGIIDNYCSDEFRDMTKRAIRKVGDTK